MNFPRILKQATRSIEQKYFQLDIAGGSPVYRERVYCYELYHQIRCIWPTDTKFTINGEVDKAAHPILKKSGASTSKPDFLIHRPGYMKGNYIIMEVKHTDVRTNGIEKDLCTLSKFIEDVNYKKAVYLFFGSGDVEKITQRVTFAFHALSIKAKIDIWFHTQSGHEAFCHHQLIE